MRLLNFMAQIIEIQSNGIAEIKLPSVKLSYQIFGKQICEAPVVLINHALTGNSSVTGENGWWKEIVGERKVIDTNKYTIIAFDLSGNQNHPDQTTVNGDRFFSLCQIAKLQLKALDLLGVKKLFAIVGGSLGGGLAWEIWVQAPNIAEYIIPIASHWQSTSWVQSICKIQEEAIQLSDQNLDLARKFSMFFYRNSGNFSAKFKDDKGVFVAGEKAVSWLDYHGKALSKRVTSSAYMNVLYLLSNINALNDKEAFDVALSITRSKFCLVGFDSDILFPFAGISECSTVLNNYGIETDSYEIETNYGHDAFLIEYEKLAQLIQPIFETH